MKLLSNKNAIITGANGGIGTAIMKKFAEEGANIWACAHKPTEEFEHKINRIGLEYDVTVKPVYFDLLYEDDIKIGIKSILSEKKQIDILVNNAAIPGGNTLHMTSMNQLQNVFQINYFAQLLIMQLVSKSMIRKKTGSIINMVSISGIETRSGYLAYGSSKAALIWATKSIAKELGPHNIRVNAVAPGLTNTNAIADKSDNEKIITETSLRRLGEPDEIADSVLFLASNKSSFVTGHILVTAGGRFND